MATTALARGARTSANLLILLLGTAVFLSYVDRGSIAVTPLMKGELKLSNGPMAGRCRPSSGSMRSAIVCRLAVRTFLSLQVARGRNSDLGGEHASHGIRRRVRFAVGAAHHARHRREPRLSGRFEDYRAARARRAARRCQCGPRDGNCPRSGGRHARWRVHP